MFSNNKSGKSLILLTIVIVVMSVALIFVMKMFNTGKTDKAQEEAFKHKTEQLYTQEEFNEENLNVYGAKLKEVIPNMAETDMSKFKIEHGKLIYIGNDTNEERWTKEVRI